MCKYSIFYMCSSQSASDLHYFVMDESRKDAKRYTAAKHKDVIVAMHQRTIRASKALTSAHLHTSNSIQFLPFTVLHISAFVFV